jgi:hypothetical protein
VLLPHLLQVLSNWPSRLLPPGFHLGSCIVHQGPTAPDMKVMSFVFKNQSTHFMIREYCEKCFEERKSQTSGILI